MRTAVQDPHLLVEFIQNQTSCSPDFKTLVLRLPDKYNDVDQVAQKTTLPVRTLYNGPMGSTNGMSQKKDVSIRSTADLNSRPTDGIRGVFA